MSGSLLRGEYPWLLMIGLLLIWGVLTVALRGLSWLMIDWEVMDKDERLIRAAVLKSIQRPIIAVAAFDSPVQDRKAPPETKFFGVLVLVGIVLLAGYWINTWFQRPKVLESHGGVQALAFNADGTHLAMAGYYGVVRYWNLADFELVQKMELIDGPTGADVDVGASGNLIASCYGKDNSRSLSAEVRQLYLWNLKTGDVKRTIRSPTYVGQSVFTPNERYVIGGNDNLYVWSVETGEVITKTHIWDMHTISISPDGKQLAVMCDPHSSSRNKGVQILSIPELSTITTVGESNEIHGVAFGHDSSSVAVAIHSEKSYVNPHKVSIIKLPGGENKTSFEVPDGWLKGVATHPGGNLIAAAAGEQVYLWRISDNKMIRKYRTKRGDAESVVFSPDGKWLAAGGPSSPVYIWDVSRFD